MSNRSGNEPTSTKKTLENSKKADLPDENEPFIIRIVNSINYRQTKLNVTKNYTIRDLYIAYSLFESEPEKYLWQDMFGNTLNTDKTLVENGVVGKDEFVYFDGIQKEPCILLIFKDGFENEKAPASLNPLYRNRTKGDDTSGFCHNY